MRAHNQSSIFSIGGKFRPDYGLLLELHTLTLVACSYVLLDQEQMPHSVDYPYSGIFSSVQCVQTFSPSYMTCVSQVNPSAR